MLLEHAQVENIRSDRVLQFEVVFSRAAISGNRCNALWFERRIDNQEDTHRIDSHLGRLIGLSSGAAEPEMMSAYDAMRDCSTYVCINDVQAHNSLETTGTVTDAPSG